MDIKKETDKVITKWRGDFDPFEITYAQTYTIYPNGTMYPKGKPWPLGKAKTLMSKKRKIQRGMAEVEELEEETL